MSSPASTLYILVFLKDWPAAHQLLTQLSFPARLELLQKHTPTKKTILHHAVHWYAPMDLIQLMIQAAETRADMAELLTKRTIDNYTPLHIFCKDTPGDLQIFDLLVSAYSPALLLKDNENRTPFELLQATDKHSLPIKVLGHVNAATERERTRQANVLLQRCVSFCLASLSRRDPLLIVDDLTFHPKDRKPAGTLTSQIMLYLSVRIPALTSLIISFVGVNARSSFSSSRCQRARNGGPPKQVNPLKLQFQNLLATQPANALKDAYADPTLPFIIDVGCGGGEWLLELSKKDSKKTKKYNYLGLEIRQNAYAASALSAGDNLHFLLCNVLAGDLQSILRDLPGPVMCVCVNYPDPNWKNLKRRMVTSAVLRSIDCNLCVGGSGGGLFFLRTDVESVLDEISAFADDPCCSLKAVEREADALYETLLEVPTERELYVKKKVGMGKESGGDNRIFTRAWRGRVGSQAYGLYAVLEELRKR